MSRPLFSTLAASLLLAGVACSQAAPPAPRTAPPMSDPLPPQRMTCDAEKAKPAVLGKPASDDTVEQARVAAGAKTARVLKPGQMVTLEFVEGRLNIDVDDAGVITQLRCG
jgi:hypothetical protein